MEKTITVTGSGSLRLKPDEAIVNLTVTGSDPAYEPAVAKATELLCGLQKALAPLGFEKSDLKTASLRVDTEYEDFRDKDGMYHQKMKGYRCTHRLELRMDFAEGDTRLPNTLSAIAASVADPELNVSFGMKDQEKASRALLQKAAENAHEKAKILTAAAGVTLGELLRIDYSWGEVAFRSETNFRMAKAMCCDAASGAAAGLSVSPEDIRVEDNATFVWAIG